MWKRGSADKDKITFYRVQKKMLACFNVDWSDDCLTMIYQLMKMDYNSVSSKARPYDKRPTNGPPPPGGGGEMEGLRIGIAIH